MSIYNQYFGDAGPKQSLALFSLVIKVIKKNILINVSNYSVGYGTGKSQLIIGMP